MKIVNEKGKLFGIINVVDLIILVAVVCLGGAIIWQLAGDRVSDAVSQETEMTVVMKVPGCHPDLVEEALRQDLVGEHLISGGVVLEAYISDMWLEDYVMQLETADGRLVDATDPTQKTICFEVKAPVAANTNTPKIGSQEVRTGLTFIFKTRTFCTNANIYYLQIGEEEQSTD